MATSEYLSVDTLKGRLRQNRFAVGGRRDQLLQRCSDHGLISDYERLATRDARSTRKAWLIFELGKVGCVLRDDSRLCQQYIDHGWGKATDVADVMAEMKFYFAHTRYDAIRDELYNEAQDEYDRDTDAYEHEREYGYADRDMRPYFRHYFDPDEVSAHAKNLAWAEWAEPRVRLADPLPWDEAGEGSSIGGSSLPRSLRAKLIKYAAKKRIEGWITSVASKRPWGEDGKFNQYLTVRTQEYKWPSDSGLEDMVWTHFDRIFEADIKDMDTIWTTWKVAESHLADCARSTSRDQHQQLLDRTKSSLKDAILRLKVNEDGYKSVVAALPTLVARICSTWRSLASNQYMDFIRKTFPDQHVAKTPFAAWAQILARWFSMPSQRASGDREWSCCSCRYAGSALGLMHHTRDRHGAKSIDEVRGKLSSGNTRRHQDPWESVEAMINAMNQEALAYKERVRNWSAIRIQCAWRKAIACPMYKLCRERLMREYGGDGRINC